MGSTAAGGKVVEAVGSQAAYARSRRARKLPGNRRAIQKRIAAGAIPPLSGGEVDVGALDEAWNRNTAQRGPGGKGGAPGNGKASVGTLVDEQRLLVAVRRRTAELEYRRLRGELVPRVKKDEGMFERARSLRDALLTAADQVAPQVAVETDVQRVRLLLRHAYTETFRVAVAQWGESV